MKRKMFLAMILALAMTNLVACGKKKEKEPEKIVELPSEMAVEEEVEAEETPSESDEDLEEAKEEVKDAADELKDAWNEAVGDAVGDAFGGSSSEESFKDGVYTTKDFTITITDYKVIQPGDKGNEYGDVPVIAFWYEVHNIGDENLDPSIPWISNFNAYQDNDPNRLNELNIASLPDDQFLDTQMEKIKIGGTVANAEAYELTDDTTPVDLKVETIMGDVIGEQRFEIK